MARWLSPRRSLLHPARCLPGTQYNLIHSKVEQKSSTEHVSSGLYCRPYVADNCPVSPYSFPFRLVPRRILFASCLCALIASWRIGFGSSTSILRLWLFNFNSLALVLQLQFFRFGSSTSILWLWFFGSLVCDSNLAKLGSYCEQKNWH